MMDLRWLAAGGALALISAPVGWHGSDVLERDNDFCNACHLPDTAAGPGAPLHIDIRRDFDSRPPPTLAAAHAVHPVEARPDAPDWRCIDCHGGASLLGKARVKVLAMKDAFFWAVGRYDEPDHMAWPLWDEDCTQCHDAFEPKSGPFEDPAFHDLSVHNVELGVDCVTCHLAHEREVNGDAYYLDARLVRSQCARCHTEFEEGPT